MGVVLNSPISDLNLLAVSRVVDIPVIITVTKADTDIRARLESGASILNVACSTDTPRIVKKIRDAFPDVPIIASGGKTGESISATIAAGAQRHHLHSAVPGHPVQRDDGKVPGVTVRKTPHVRAVAAVQPLVFSGCTGDLKKF